ncbi:hypothetical protein [Microbacterium indicum]|uniref:hypothetical protein n=1 Tax=Microbacterium indicum TaxID=358100 RepID=UPI00048A6285
MPTKYDAEFRTRALRMLEEARPDHPNRMTAVRHVAGPLGMSAETLRTWPHREIVGGSPAATAGEVIEENTRVSREFAELRKPNEILEAASVSLAKEPDRPSTR